MITYRWNGNNIPNDLTPWQTYTLKCCKFLQDWTIEELKDCLELKMNDSQFYTGTRGQTSSKNVRKYWDYVHSNNKRHHVYNIKTYYTIY